MPLFEYLLIKSSLVDLSKRVSDYWVSDISWNWAVLSGLLPPHVEDRLATIIIWDEYDDNLCWGYNTNGFFSVSSTYKLSTGDIFFNVDRGWKDYSSIHFSS